ncbi:CHY zinc finger protein [Salarchaeum japonicum]|nr:CHY zinc finger protein [Salarchaeum japonicum]
MEVVHGREVYGVGVGPETRCAHYDSAVDVIAIRFACCGEYYPCYECHESVADHEAAVWEDASARAVLCGVCGRELTVGEYLDCENTCPGCGAAFNPGCRRHYDRYFAADVR